ncbi:hypothetical protein AB3X52_16935 [Nocardioides sp. DS6]|uniref:Uncharacterized protein n=1 Tax=Nocardioides eburneus TaxID=3231482 RepID=A0ABV3T292_9ACTN
MLIRILEGVAWWVTLLAAYVVLISSISLPELVAGAALAALASVVAMVATRGLRPAAPPIGLRWRHLLLLPVAIVRDLGVLVARLGAREAHVGTTEDLRLPEAGEPRAVRAYAVLALSISPAAYVLDVWPGEPADREPGSVRVHRLGAAGGIEGLVGE